MSPPPTGLVRALGGMALSGVRDALERSSARSTEDASSLEARTEPPVVAQLMIEIRSDGSHTIARGALHDLRSQESAHVHAEGRSPAELIASLLGSLMRLPAGTFERLRAAPEPDKRTESLPRNENDSKG